MRCRARPSSCGSGNTRTSVDGEADALAARRGQQYVVVFGTDLHIDDRLVGIELHGDDAGAPDVDEVRQLVAADIAARWSRT